MEHCQRFQQCGGAFHVAVLYTVVAPDGTKGIILDNCTTYGNALFGEYLVKLKLHQLTPQAPKRANAR
ncbi:hypothetical protein [Rufibacter immobilis]